MAISDEYRFVTGYEQKGNECTSNKDEGEQRIQNYVTSIASFNLYTTIMSLWWPWIQVT
jgi:hypothetical protein